MSPSVLQQSSLILYWMEGVGGKVLTRKIPFSGFGIEQMLCSGVRLVRNANTGNLTQSLLQLTFLGKYSRRISWSEIIVIDIGCENNGL